MLLRLFDHSLVQLGNLEVLMLPKFVLMLPKFVVDSCGISLGGYQET